MTFYYRGRGHAPLAPPLDPLLHTNKKSRIYGTSDQSISFAQCESPICEAVGGRIRPPTASHFGLPLRPPVRGRVRPKWEAVRGRVRPKWEAVRGQFGRPCEAEVGGQFGRPIWEAVRGRSGRPCEAEVGGRARPKWEAEVGGRSGRPIWEAV